MGTDTNAVPGGANAAGTNNRNRRNNGRNSRRTPRPANNVNTFTGTVTEMNGQVFQCYGEATEKNQFARTMEELNSYVGLHFKNHPADIKKMIKTLEDTF
jgi:hypothetical protein